MNKYTFRVDVIPQYPREYIEELIHKTLKQLKCDKCIISLEEADKTKKLHYQGIIFTDVKRANYKRICEEIFDEWKGGRGQKNGLRSFNDVKTDNYEVYVTKDYNFAIIKGYTKEEIDELYDKSYKKKNVRIQCASAPINGGKQEFDTTLYKLYKDMTKIPGHCKWDMIRIGVFIQDWYLENYGKYPMDHFAKSLVKGLWVMANKNEQVYRKASIAYSWVDENFMAMRLKPTVFEHISDCILSDVSCMDSKIVNWDPIEKEVLT